MSAPSHCTRGMTYCFAWVDLLCSSHLRVMWSHRSHGEHGCYGGRFGHGGEKGMAPNLAREGERHRGWILRRWTWRVKWEWGFEVFKWQLQGSKGPCDAGLEEVEAGWHAWTKDFKTMAKEKDNKAQGEGGISPQADEEGIDLSANEGLPLWAEDESCQLQATHEGQMRLADKCSGNKRVREADAGWFDYMTLYDTIWYYAVSSGLGNGPLGQNMADWGQTEIEWDMSWFEAWKNLCCRIPWCPLEEAMGLGQKMSDWDIFTEHAWEW